jgi:hypothetical protein
MGRMIDVADIVSQARKSFGHIPGRSDVECLALMVSMLQRHTAERNEALALNANQAGMMGRQYLEIDAMRKQLHELRSRVPA